MTDHTGGFVSGSIRQLLRAEGLVILLFTLLVYARLDSSWLLFLYLVLLPDVSLAGYLAGPRVGAIAYNIAHTYALPLLLAAGLLMTNRNIAIALIWIAHIAVDRFFGLGLKYTSGFRDTHLGRVGK